jgi:hypothetical protein
MMLTAAAVVVGSLVILFDPIFQGLAIALMAGEIASLALSRMTVPVVYYMVARRGHKGEKDDGRSDVKGDRGNLRTGVAGAGTLR